ncbi:MAG: GNAT family N-acetyltransferase [Clostridia bacterium]|nr:GNAT family N-acetyltransferase [Clostridia bacterium]
MLEFSFVYGENGYMLSRDLRAVIFGGEASDDMENESYHIVGYDKTEQIAVGRFSPISETVCRIDFVGVREDYRRQYVGDLVIKAIEDKAKTLGIKTAVLETPDLLLPFFEFEMYENMGKTENGTIKMRKDLMQVHKCRGCM